ncbi:MAG: acyl-CoA dehydrogenase family protein [Dehalococcoidia bacterium]|nr:acyl-CoA dehydrogenase family protein [Dehalococcoidia bacterium]
MEFKFTEEEEAFRREVREFLRKEWTLGSVDLEEPGMYEEARKFEKKMAERGWRTMHWPKEYGGQGASHMMQIILREEMAYVGARILDGQGVHMIGPCIMVHGTEEQKKRFLPPIARCEVLWAQGFSEPNAGSDLASLQLKAVKDGDDYILNGQKTWTSAGTRGDWVHVLARTDPNAPKHRGISYFVVDMKSPGITIAPIINMAGRAGFTDTYFDDVRVPKEQMIGEENRGWYVAMTTLDFERSSISFAAESARTLEELVRYATETKRDGVPLIRDVALRNKLAEMAIEIEVARLINYNVAWMQQKGLIPNYQASMAKTFGTELHQRLANVGVHLLGLYGGLDEKSKWAPLKGRIKYLYLWTVGETIYAGSNEIQRNIMAQRGLGLPRE